MQVNSLSSIAANATSTSATSSTSSTSSSSSSANSLADPNLFISLLTAQLQAQDPLDPMTPDDMVNQLTEVSSLQQLVSINQTLTNISTGTPDATSTTSQSNPLGSI
jgi:flagellar basal-body rod modification protein FlgD